MNETTISILIFIGILFCAGPVALIRHLIDTHVKKVNEKLSIPKEKKKQITIVSAPVNVGKGKIKITLKNNKVLYSSETLGYAHYTWEGVTRVINCEAKYTLQHRVYCIGNGENAFVSINDTLSIRVSDIKQMEVITEDHFTSAKAKVDFDAIIEGEYTIDLFGRSI